MCLLFLIPSRAIQLLTSVVDTKLLCYTSNRYTPRIQKAAARSVAVEDVWAKHDIPSIPAEHVVRHLYNHSTQLWSTEDTIVKMEPEPFTHGAMRFCYRMKKLATPPASASNHRFHKYGWSRASNYVAKAYIVDGAVDCSDDAKVAVRNDIVLQYEASHWAQRFNSLHPPKEICFIRAYAMEFTDRPGSPMFAVERFIAGKDKYGTGFLKHNTNSGYVDRKQHRKTPQVFSAYSFYASQGKRLVADIQGVGDLYTDPQVLSDDYRFGDGDLGPRGMALFFHSFTHCSLCDAVGIPIFPLSRNEIKQQVKYGNDEATVRDDEETTTEVVKLTKLERIDQNHHLRKHMLSTSLDLYRPGDEMATEKRSNLTLDLNQPEDEMATEKRSNVTTREDIRKAIRKSMTVVRLPPRQRTKSDADEIALCLSISTQEPVIEHRCHEQTLEGDSTSSEDAKSLEGDSSSSEVSKSRRGSVMKISAPPMIPDESCRAMLGKIHYELACLHGMGRFPETVPEQQRHDTVAPDHDIFSVVCHLAHAASLYNVPACLALARVQAGLDSTVSTLLTHTLSVNFDVAKDLLQRALESPQPLSGPKAAAGCLLFQIMQDEEGTSEVTLLGILEDTLALMVAAEKEIQEVKQFEDRMAQGGGLLVGDKVMANYCLEGEYYSGVVVEVFEDGKLITVQYTDDGSTESLTAENVRPLIPPTASLKSSSIATFGGENTDERCILESFVVKAELAELKAKAGDVEGAASLFEEAAYGAMTAGKLQSATTWSLQAAELLGCKD